eukprot:3833329-Rhodomonas_salina.1
MTTSMPSVPNTGLVLGSRSAPLYHRHRKIRILLNIGDQEAGNGSPPFPLLNQSSVYLQGSSILLTHEPCSTSLCQQDWSSPRATVQVFLLPASVRQPPSSPRTSCSNAPPPHLPPPPPT